MTDARASAQAAIRNARERVLRVRVPALAAESAAVEAELGAVAEALDGPHADVVARAVLALDAERRIRFRANAERNTAHRRQDARIRRRKIEAAVAQVRREGVPPERWARVVSTMVGVCERTVRRALKEAAPGT